MARSPLRRGARPVAAILVVFVVAWLVVARPVPAVASDAPVPSEAAAAPAPAPEDEEAGAIVVVARRAPEDPFRSARSVQGLAAGAVEDAGARTVPEALAELPGVFVQQTNPGGGAPIIRGLVGPQNLILVDGVRFNNSLHRTGPTQYLNLIDPFFVRRLEVLRGPGSVLYGSDAMGGVIQVLPLLPPDARRAEGVERDARALLRFGSASRERTGHVGAGLAAGDFGARIGFTTRSFGDLSGGRGVGVQPYTSYDQWAAAGSAVWRAAPGSGLEGWSATLTYLGGFQDDAERADKYETKGTIQIYDDTDHLLYGRLRMDLRAIRTDLDLTVSYHRFFERTDGVTFTEDRTSERDRTRDEVSADTVGVDLHATTALLDGRLRLQYGGGWYRDLVSAEGQLARAAGAGWAPTGRASFPDGAVYDVYGGFVLAEGEPVRTADGHVLRLGLGWRLHGAAADAPARTDLPAAAFSHLGHVVHGSASWLWRDRLTVAATFSQGFRAPSLSEAVMLGATGQWFHVPNDAGLGPERSDTVELLARGRLGPVTVGAAGWVSLLHDVIKRVPTTWDDAAEVGGRPVVHNVNGGEGVLVGVEGQAAVALGAGLSLRGDLTWTRGEEDVGGGPDVPLSRIPPLFGQLALRWDAGVGGWHGFAETLLRGALEQDRLSPEDETDARIPAGGTPSWWAWDLRLGVAFEDRWRVGLTVANLTDNRYRVHGSGIWGAGTSATLTAEGRL